MQRGMRTVALLLLAAAASAQEAEPGPLPAALVRVGKLDIPPREGDAATALRTFVGAHEKHEQEDRDGALAGYLAFLGMPGRHELPARYVKTVLQRVSDLRRAVRERYDEALALYRRDRAKGVGELLLIAGRYPMLPEGKAAKVFWHSDRLRAAIAKARETAKDGRPKLGAADLETAVRRFTAGLYRYEAKTLLIELGGPDLFEPGERIEETGDAPAPERDDKEDDKGGGIEISDDDG